MTNTSSKSYRGDYETLYVEYTKNNNVDSY